jgi:endothelin-converting enzyme/putative endopeptidase
MKFSWFRRFRITIQCRREFRWWTAEDSKQFSALTTAFAPVQCSRAITRNFVDGKFTLGENIDLGGINAAYDGLQLYLKENGNRLN